MPEGAQGNHQVASLLVPFHTYQVVSVFSLFQSTMLMTILFFLHILLIFLLYIMMIGLLTVEPLIIWSIPSMFSLKLHLFAHITVKLPNGESVIVTHITNITNTQDYHLQFYIYYA